MYEVDFNWAKEQLTKNKTKVHVGNSVLFLLKSWSIIKNPTKVDMYDEILDTFSKLARGYALVEDNKNEVWVQAMSGQIKLTDVVRVKHNAFDGKSGKNTLNGRRGVIVGLRSGDIVIKTNDEALPVLEGIHVKAEFLEKLVS